MFLSLNKGKKCSLELIEPTGIHSVTVDMMRQVNDKVSSRCSCCVTGSKMAKKMAVPSLG